MLQVTTVLVACNATTIGCPPCKGAPLRCASRAIAKRLKLTSAPRATTRHFSTTDGRVQPDSRGSTTGVFFSEWRTMCDLLSVTLQPASVERAEPPAVGDVWHRGGLHDQC